MPKQLCRPKDAGMFDVADKWNSVLCSIRVWEYCSVTNGFMTHHMYGCMALKPYPLLYTVLKCVHGLQITVVA